FKGHTSQINSVAFSPDGTLVVSGSSDETVRVWDSQTGDSVLSPLKWHTGRVNSVAFSPDGTRIVSGAYDNTIVMWDARIGAALFSFPISVSLGVVFLINSYQCIALEPNPCFTLFLGNYRRWVGRR